jgi:glycosyltransferase involved in cell wall biosynthesis
MGTLENNTSTVAIVVATYNGATYLLAQLESIIQQTHKPVQIIIVDDASSDDTITIAHAFATAHPEVMVVQNETRLGYIKNFEKGMLLANASYVALSDQDDIWVPYKIEKLLAAIGDQMLAYSDSELIDANGHLLHQKMSSIKNQLAYHTPIMYAIGAWAPGHAMLFKKELIDKAVPFPTLVTHDFWLGFVATCYSKVVYVNEPLVHYRQHTQNAIGADTTKNKSASLNLAQKKQQARERMGLLYNKVKATGHADAVVFEKINDSYSSFSLSNNLKRAKLFFDYRNLILAYKKKSALLKILFAVKMFFKID